jgi:hypothetical protein
VYSTCEAGKRRTVNHTRARSLASPRQAEAEARRGAARCDAVRVRVRGRTDGRDVQVQCDVMC